MKRMPIYRRTKFRKPKFERVITKCKASAHRTRVHKREPRIHIIIIIIVIIVPIEIRFLDFEKIEKLWIEMKLIADADPVANQTIFFFCNCGKVI